MEVKNIVILRQDRRWRVLYDVKRGPTNQSADLGINKADPSTIELIEAADRFFGERVTKFDIVR